MYTPYRDIMDEFGVINPDKYTGPVTKYKIGSRKDRKRSRSVLRKVFDKTLVFYDEKARNRK